MRPAMRGWASAAIMAGGLAVANWSTGTEVEGQGSTWYVSWADEFTGSAVDTSIWSVENSTSESYGGNLQAWRPANVTVSGSNLTLQSRRESSGGKSYTSGAITTKNKKTFGPGDFRLEVSADLPVGQGVWPAIWMREGSMPNPDTGTEIDLMELLGQDPRRVYMTQHVWNQGTHVARPAACEATDQDYTTGFHTYMIEKVGGTLRWYIDGVVRCTSTTNAPVQPSYLLINTSIGGAWPGPPSASTPFPQNFVIDYVRLYEKGSSTQPKDAVVGPWGPWTPTSEWSSCSGGQQYRTERRTREVIEPAENGGTTPPLEETRTTSQACSTNQPLPSATMTVRTCTLTVSSNTTPDGSTGWSVQYYRNGQTLGYRDSSAPYTQSASVYAGSHNITATWTKSGASTVTQTIGTRVCE